MTPQHRELFERCAEIVRRTKIRDAYGEVYLSTGPGTHQRAYRCIEHTFHESAHAVLCGIPTNTINLSLAISETIGDLLDAQANEARTFAACTLAFDHFGIEYHRGDLCNAIEMQCVSLLGIGWDDVELLRAESLVQRTAETLIALRPEAPVRPPMRRVVKREHIRRPPGELITLDCGHTTERSVMGNRMYCYLCLVRPL